MGVYKDEHLAMVMVNFLYIIMYYILLIKLYRNNSSSHDIISVLSAMLSSLCNKQIDFTHGVFMLGHWGSILCRLISSQSDLFPIQAYYIQVRC